MCLLTISDLPCQEVRVEQEHRSCQRKFWRDLCCHIVIQCSFQEAWYSSSNHHALSLAWEQNRLSSTYINTSRQSTLLEDLLNYISKLNLRRLAQLCCQYLGYCISFHLVSSLCISRSTRNSKSSSRCDSKSINSSSSSHMSLSSSP